MAQSSAEGPVVVLAGGTGGAKLARHALPGLLAIGVSNKAINYFKGAAADPEAVAQSPITALAERTISASDLHFAVGLLNLLFTGG